MSEFKGTPGPWFKDVRYIKRQRAIVAVIPKNSGNRIYETILQTGHIDSDDDCGVETCCRVEEHSNARLIAASPDLLNACQKIINHYNLKGELLSFDINIVREALNKAINPK